LDWLLITVLEHIRRAAAADSPTLLRAISAS
jgi:hypothetical protein